MRKSLTCIRLPTGLTVYPSQVGVPGMYGDCSGCPDPPQGSPYAILNMQSSEFTVYPPQNSLRSGFVPPWNRFRARQNGSRETGRVF